MARPPLLCQGGDFAFPAGCPRRPCPADDLWVTLRTEEGSFAPIPDFLCKAASTVSAPSLSAQPESFFRTESGLFSGRRRQRRAASLTDEFQIRDVNIVGRVELHLRLTGDARLLHCGGEPVSLKLLKGLLRLPNVQHAECACRETGDVKDAT